MKPLVISLVSLSACFSPDNTPDETTEPQPVLMDPTGDWRLTVQWNNDGQCATPDATRSITLHVLAHQEEFVVVTDFAEEVVTFSLERAETTATLNASISVTTPNFSELTTVDVTAEADTGSIIGSGTNAFSSADFSCTQTLDVSGQLN